MKIRQALDQLFFNPNLKRMAKDRNHVRIHYQFYCFLETLDLLTPSAVTGLRESECYDCNHVY